MVSALQHAGMFGAETETETVPSQQEVVDKLQAQLNGGQAVIEVIEDGITLQERKYVRKVRWV